MIEPNCMNTLIYDQPPKNHFASFILHERLKEKKHFLKCGQTDRQTDKQIQTGCLALLV